ncbi:hypothetical protein P7C70_g7845, partial [Phenoliferia sp. Uapishka_3]
MSADPFKRSSSRLANAPPALATSTTSSSNIFSCQTDSEPASLTPTKRTEAKEPPPPPHSPHSPRSKGPPAPVLLIPKSKFGWSERKSSGTGSESDETVDLVVVSARTWEKRVENHQWSWLLKWEFARYLHAGVPELDIVVDRLPGQVLPRKPVPVLQNLHDYMQKLAPSVNRPKESIYQEIPECESAKEMEAAFRVGTIQFTASLEFEKGSTKPTLSLNPPSVEGRGHHFSYKFGSDRFLRVRLHDTITNLAGLPPTAKPDSLKEKQLAELHNFFGSAPLHIFGRQYRAFNYKEGAVMFWCESGPGLKTISLVEFSEAHISHSINQEMSIAKFSSRFELGLSTSTPTVRFLRNQVLRVPDILSDSLSISYSFINTVCEILRQDDSGLASEALPDGYVGPIGPEIKRGLSRP